MTTTIEIPDINFAGMYYAQILEALVDYKRRNLPEHTDESEYDPLMQLLRAFALVGHLNNTLIDLVANEATLPTARLSESIRNMLRLIDYELRTATPAQAELVWELSKVFAVSYTLVNEGALAATEREGSISPVIFEILADQDITPTDEIGVCLADESLVFTDYTTEVNSQTTPGDDFAPWATPASKDAIYFGHPEIMWNELDIWLTTPVQGDQAEGSVTNVAQANLLDGDNFIVDDGVNPAVTFYFDVTGTYVPGGGYDATNIRVDVSGDTSAEDVAITVAAAINGAPTLNMYAAPLTGPLDHVDHLRNTVGGSHGNVPLVENVADGGFSVSGMIDGNDDTLEGVWEYYDGDYTRVAPTTVNNYAPGQLLVDLTSLLGSEDRTGTLVRVQLNETGAYEDVEVQWTGTENVIITTTWLGQTSPSIDAEDYSVGMAWYELETLTDGTAGLTQNGKVDFDLPQNLVENWRKTTVDGNEAYFLRFRIISVGTITTPIFQYARIDQGKQYLLTAATQGRTREEAPLGSSDGSANQRFETSKDYFISGTMTVEVDGEEWLLVENFLSSLPTDKHYTVEVGENDRATVVFGDGTTGKIPPVGVNNIAATYRYLGAADEDGNVGSNTIVVNKSGVTYVNQVWNPRQASGYDAGDAADEASLEQAKIAGPASLRTGDVALGPTDLARKTLDYVDAAGASPFSRAFGVEEGYGPKTIELVVVVKGGTQATSAQLEALNEYFNGDQYAHPPLEKRVVANQEVVAVNFTPKTIDIEATVYGDITVGAIENRLAQILQPEALKGDGVTWEWSFGEEVPVSRIIHEIFETAETIEKVELTTPAADVTLASRELPVLGTVTITVVSS
jgi:hypothetical protein